MAIKRAVLFFVFLIGYEAVFGAADQSTERLQAKYRGLVPSQWGENVTGVLRRLETQEPVIALTLDACGSAKDGFDQDLISFLEEENIPATLFINARWIDKHPAVFMRLSQNPLFKIENHGFLHRPASVNGRTVYGLMPVHDVRDLIHEIRGNGLKIQQETGRLPQYYRSGGAYYDEIAVQISEDLGYRVAGYSLLGDKGATYSKAQVRSALLQAKPGDVVILHMNHPEGETAEGVMAAVPELRKKGFRFVHLDDFSFVS